MTATQLALETHTVRSCSRVLLRLRTRSTVKEWSCLRLPHHAGEHIFWPIERLRDETTVSVGGGVL